MLRPRTRTQNLGLDSTNAANIVDILADLASSGVNVILTIHQPRPDVFRLMNRVVLLSGTGQVRLLTSNTERADHSALPQ